MRSQNSTVEQKLAAIASRQHGAVARAQLLAAGISHAGIQRRLASGALHPQYRGVYRVGHRAPSLEATYMAAVLACGGRSVLADAAAAFLYGLTKGRAPLPVVATPSQRRIKGIVTRRCTRPATTHRGIPIATVPSVLVDLAAHLSADAL